MAAEFRPAAVKPTVTLDDLNKLDIRVGTKFQVNRRATKRETRAMHLAIQQEPENSRSAGCQGRSFEATVSRSLSIRIE